MSGWAVPVSQGPGVTVPDGYQIAGMGRRIGAWLLDGIFVGFLSIIPVVLAIVTGAVTLNQQAIDQLRQMDPEAYQPFSTVTAPLFNVSMSPLIVAAVVYVLLNAAYYAGCWIKWGGSPAQLMLKLRVADVTTGENLAIDASVLRWAFLQGISTILGAVFLILFLDALSKTSMAEWFGSGYGSTFSFGSGSLGGVTLLSNLVSWGSSLWLILLIATAGTNPAKRGLHDRLSGSIVLGPVQAAPTLGQWPAQQGQWPAQQAQWAPQQGQWPGQQPPGPWPGQPQAPWPPQQAPWPPQQGQWPAPQAPWPQQPQWPGQPMQPPQYTPPDRPAPGASSETPGQ